MADIDQVREGANLMKDKAKSAAGDVLGDAKLQAEGHAGEAIDRLQAAYDRRREQISDQLSQVEGFAKSRPWAALAIAAAVLAAVVPAWKTTQAALAPQLRDE